MKKKKVFFLAPKNKWWTYFYYKDISKYLLENYSDNYEVYFYNSFFDYIKLHFIKADIIFSIIPFVFKPLLTKKYIFNLHWNYKIERKNKWLWVKLLYLTELNLWFSDKIMLTSYYLADKLNFRKKYNRKIIIVPNFIKNVYKNTKYFSKKEIRLLTISSSNFFDKAIWIFNLAKEIFKLDDVNILWEVVFPWNISNKEKIFRKINELNKNTNIKLKFYDFIEKKDLEIMYKKSDIYVYSSDLETWGLTILEACSFWKPIILLENDLWWYIYPKEFISFDFAKNFKKIIFNYNYYSNKSYDFACNFLLSKIVDNLVKNEILNYNTHM